MPNDREPLLIAHTTILDQEGNEDADGTSVVAVAVYQDKDAQRRGEVQMVVRDYDGHTRDLIIRLPLPELMASLGLATLNAERDLA